VKKKKETVEQKVFRLHAERQNAVIDELKAMIQTQAVQISSLTRDIADRDADPEPDDQTLGEVTTRMVELMALTDCAILELHHRHEPFLTHDGRMKTSRAEMIADILCGEFDDKFAVRRS